MEQELEQLRTQLQETVERYEASTEKLKARNQELQTMNERLRSATDDLETSLEELQAINEALTTVNQELKGKVEELGQANNDLSNFMSATDIATLFVDRHLHITGYTPTAASLFHLIKSDVGRPMTDLTHRLKYPDMREDAERVLATLIPFKREVPDSEGRWFLAQLLPYRTAEDQIAGAVLSFVNITESRKAEQALREAEERMRFATEAANIYGWETDPETLKTRYASNTERVLGFQLPEHEKDLTALIHPDDRDEVGSKFAEARANKGGFDMDYRLVNPESGATVWVSSHGIFVVGFPGKERFVGITQDITGRRQAEEALRESQEWLRLIVENARDYAIVSMDLERRVTSWNSGAQAILGYEPEEMLGQTADVIFTPEDRAAGAAEQEALKALAEGRATDERWHVCKDGARFWGSGVMMPMRDARGEAVGLVKIFRDQTNELRAKEALEHSREDLLAALRETEAARAEAEGATRAKDHLLAVLSHELRTPLTPILMSVEIMKRRSDLPAPVIDALEMIRRNAVIEARFVDDLLDITRIARGKLEILSEPLDVHEAISEAIKISTPDIEAKEQVLRVALDAGEHRMTGDLTRLQQVFWNLLKNASKFSPIKSEIWLRSRNEPGRIIIDLTDQGIGIEEEALPRIFHAFEQADRKVTREFGGLGLGLAIAKATVEAHDGVLKVASPGAGQGATFTVELPL